MHVDWSNDATEDLNDLIRYISRDSAYYAEVFAEKIVLATGRLRNFPESGRQIPEAPDDSGLREIIVQGYRVMYRIEPERVLVLAVMHGSRNLAGMDTKPWQED